MASRYYRSRNTTTTTIQDVRKEDCKERILVLKEKTTSRLERETETAKQELAGKKSAEEVDEYVDNVFQNVQNEFNRGLNEIKQDVKANAPRRPRRQDYANDKAFAKAEETYQNDLSSYKEYVSFVAGIMSRMVEFFRDLFQSIKEFFQKLWTWIKTMFKEIGKKVREFVDYVKEKFQNIVEFIFG